MGSGPNHKSAELLFWGVGFLNPRVQGFGALGVKGSLNPRVLGLGGSLNPGPRAWV